MGRVRIVGSGGLVFSVVVSECQCSLSRGGGLVLFEVR